MRNQDRSAQIASELIEAQFLYLSGSVEGLAGVECVVSEKLVGRAMELAAAALGVNGNHDTGVAAVLGAESAGLQFELAHRVEADLRVLAVVGADVGVDGAVEKDVVAAASLTVHVERIRIVEGQAEVARVVGYHARQRAHQRLKVAPIQRYLGDLLGADDERFL